MRGPVAEPESVASADWVDSAVASAPDAELDSDDEPVSPSAALGVVAADWLSSVAVAVAATVAACVAVLVW